MIHSRAVHRRDWNFRHTQFRRHGAGLFFGTLCLLLLSCDFRHPDEGYDPDWEPDHDGIESHAEPNRPGSGNDDSIQVSEGSLRPADVAADTATMVKVPGTWEMVGEIPSEFTVYRQNGKLAMIVEIMGDHTRTYYFDQGALFYYNEIGASGGFDLTVEFDEIGDVIGTRWLLNGERIRVRREDVSEIVEHAVELKIRAEETAESLVE